MALQSLLFQGDSKLEAAAISDPAHIVQGARGPHVGKIQAALIDLDGASITLDEAYGPATAAAVRAFKTKRGILNTQGKIDGIVGKKTIAALDAEMAVLERGRTRGLLNFSFDAPIVDFVVRFRAGAFLDAKANLDATKLAEHAKKPNRRLHLISKAANIGDQALINGVIAEIDKVLKDEGAEPGLICINGNSAGARNALELAAALNGKRDIKFVGCADAAMFPNLAGLNEPEPLNATDITGGKAKNTPLWGGAPTFKAEIKNNFFQTADNFWSRRNLAFKREWTGRTGDSLREIHGKLPGFADGGGTEIQIPVSVRVQPGPAAHNFAGDEGDRRNGAAISRLLAEA